MMSQRGVYHERNGKTIVEGQLEKQVFFSGNIVLYASVSSCVLLLLKLT